MFRILLLKYKDAPRAAPPISPENNGLTFASLVVVWPENIVIAEAIKPKPSANAVKTVELFFWLIWQKA